MTGIMVEVAKTRSKAYSDEIERRWSPVTIAMAIDKGWLRHTPLQMTREGWRTVRRGRARENGMTLENGGRG